MNSAHRLFVRMEFLNCYWLGENREESIESSLEIYAYARACLTKGNNVDGKPVDAKRIKIFINTRSRISFISSENSSAHQYKFKR